MDIWRHEFVAIIRGLLANPSTRTEGITLAVSAAIACIVALRLMSIAFGLKQTEWWRVICVLVVTTALTLTVVAAVRIYLLGETSTTALRLGLQIGAAILVILIVGIPLQLFLQHGSYIQSCLTVAATLIVTALITAGVYTGYHATRAGGEQMQRATERNKETGLSTE